MYIVLELQTNGDKTSSIVTSYKDENIAHQAFYTALASASVSSVPVHAVVLLNEIGIMEKREFYDRRS